MRFPSQKTHAMHHGKLVLTRKKARVVFQVSKVVCAFGLLGNLAMLEEKEGSREWSWFGDHLKTLDPAMSTFPSLGLQDKELTLPKATLLLAVHLYECIADIGQKS